MKLRVVKKNKHIFFVEEDLSLINGLFFAIGKQGYELTIARTRIEAEQLWQSGKQDLVVLDVFLPEVTGFDLCRAIRQNSNVPIIFLTGLIAAEVITYVVP